MKTINSSPTRGNNVLDLVISSVPDQVSVTEVMEPNEAEMFTDHCIVSFELASAVKAPPKLQRFVYDYARGDFDELCSSFEAVNLSNTISTGNFDIDRDWYSWKDTFLAGVADYIPKKKLKGRNPVPWINGPILTRIKKMESLRKKLRLSPSSFLKAKFKDLRSKVKRMLLEARDSFLRGMESQLKCNPKRFWSTLKLKSKHRGIPEVISMATGPSGDPAADGRRIHASSPTEIVDLFNRYFVSVFTSDPVTCKSVDEEDAGPNVDLTLSDLTLTVSQVLDVLANLDASRATGLMRFRPGF